MAFVTSSIHIKGDEAMGRYSKNDIIAGLRKAAKRLFNDTENHRTTDRTRIARIYTTPRTGRHAASNRAGARINELV